MREERRKEYRVVMWEAGVCSLAGGKREHFVTGRCGLANRETANEGVSARWVVANESARDPRRRERILYLFPRGPV